MLLWMKVESTRFDRGSGATKESPKSQSVRRGSGRSACRALRRAACCEGSSTEYAASPPSQPPVYGKSGMQAGAPPDSSGAGGRAQAFAKSASRAKRAKSRPVGAIVLRRGVDRDPTNRRPPWRPARRARSVPARPCDGNCCSPPGAMRCHALHVAVASRGRGTRARRSSGRAIDDGCAGRSGRRPM